MKQDVALEVAGSASEATHRSEGGYFSERLIEFRVGELYRVGNYESKSSRVLVAIAGSFTCEWVYSARFGQETKNVCKA
jgi:hypothetical protein